MSYEVKCDTCGTNLSETSNSVDYRISLHNERIPSWGGAVTDMMIYPPLKGGFHFCGVRCLQLKVEKL